MKGGVYLYQILQDLGRVYLYKERGVECTCTRCYKIRRERLYQILRDGESVPIADTTRRLGVECTYIRYKEIGVECTYIRYKEIGGRVYLY